MDQSARKLMTMRNVLYPRDDIDRLYVSRKGEGRWHASIENNVDTSLRQLENNIKKNKKKANNSNQKQHKQHKAQ